MAVIIETESIELDKMHGDRGHYIYNGLDCCLTHEIHGVISQQLDHNTALIYQYERALQAPALDMMVRGILIDQEAKVDMLQMLYKQQARFAQILNEYAHAVWGRELNPQSPAQLQAFFYKTMRIPEVYSRKKGESKVSTDREALEHISAYFYARPIVAVILALRDVNKKISTLKTGIDADGRIRTSYSVAGTETGRWCCDGVTEVLTRKGWVKFEDWDDSDEIVVCSLPSGLAEWAKATKVEFDSPSRLYKLTTTRFNAVFTGEHKLGYIDSRDVFRTAAIREMKFLSRVPVAAKLKDTCVDSAITRVCVMMQADGHVLNSIKVRFHFRKERKIARCKMLLEEAKLSYRQTVGGDGSTYIYVESTPWLAEAKYFGPWLLQHDAEVVLDELQYWDGELDRNGGTVYYTSIKENAEWVKTISHIAGRFASIRYKRKFHETWADSFRVFIGFDAHTRIKKDDYRVVNSASAKVYCAQTPTGYFLVRRAGQIHVTGNSSSANAFGTGSNLQNITGVLRRIFVADRGYKLAYIDLEQAESRGVGLLAWLATTQDNYLRACDSGDLHTLTTKMVWKNLAWTGELSKDKEIAEQKFYRDFSYRDLAKRGSHGSNYGAQPPTISRHLKIPLDLAKSFQYGYFKGFPEIPLWHEHTAKLLRTTGQLTTPLGRKRMFFDRLNDDSTLRAAIAYVPQSMVADILNLGAYKIWRDIPKAQLLAQIHDAVIVQYREEDEAEVVAACLAAIQTKFYFNGREFMIPAEAQVGWNWAKQVTEESLVKKYGSLAEAAKKGQVPNLDGLVKWKGKDARTRQYHPSDKPLSGLALLQKTSGQQ